MPPEHEGAMFLENEVSIIREWIANGAPAPEGEKPEADPKDHWAYQKIKRPPLPYNVSDKNPVDAFIHSKHLKMGLRRQPPAEPKILLRRLYLDLIGLPPTTDQLLTNASYEDTVDLLLTSPHYGERWGRHWMDVWRYSDWYGLGGMLRHSQKHLWHWRDWIVRSLNQDKGYDRMIMEMLAGDELDPANEDAVTGTGYLARSYYVFNRNTWLDATIEHSAKAFLGITMNCAKCHDHKYDPISQVDYYNYRSFFEPHHLRLDALPGETNFDKNALPRAYDRDLNATTALFLRGDPALPDNQKNIRPLVPKMFREFAPKSKPSLFPQVAGLPAHALTFRMIKSNLQSPKVLNARKDLQEAESLKKAKPPEVKKDNLTNQKGRILYRRV
jgi:hypothetical protein